MSNRFVSSGVISMKALSKCRTSIRHFSDIHCNVIFYEYIFIFNVVFMGSRNTNTCILPLICLCGNSEWVYSFKIYFLILSSFRGIYESKWKIIRVLLLVVIYVRKDCLHSVRLTLLINPSLVVIFLSHHLNFWSSVIFCKFYLHFRFFL